MTMARVRRGTELLLSPQSPPATGGLIVLTGLRLLAGLIWLYNVVWKVPPDFGERGRRDLYHFTHLAVEHPVFTPFSWVIEHAVLPYFTAFGWGVLFAESALAVLLLTGTAVRLAALIGIGQSVAIGLSVADARSNQATALAPVRFFNPIAMRFAQKATREDIDDVLAAHAHAARLAVDAGFDAVEIHLGHNYLASAFLSPLLNRRDDEFGGSLQNRAKVARGLVMAVRRAVRQQVAVTAKLNMTDGIRGGITVDEALTTARWLQDDGGLDAIELTAGSSLVNPMYLFRGDAPVKEFAAAFKPPLRWGIRMTGHRFFREYPYRDAYLLREARLFRAELTIPLILLGGITNRTTMDLAMAEGFEFVAMARALLAEPDLVNRIAAEGSQVRSACTHCNQCMATIYRRTHCVVTGAP